MSMKTARFTDGSRPSRNLNSPPRPAKRSAKRRRDHPLQAQHLLRQFLDYLRIERALSDNTVQAYRRDLSHLLELHQADAGLALTEWLSAGTIAKFLRVLSEQGLSEASIARHLAAVRMFCRYLVIVGELSSSPAEVMSQPKGWLRLPKVISKERMQQLLAGPEGDSPLALRDRALLELLYGIGARISEVTGLDLDDVVAHLEAGHAGSHGDDFPGSFVARDDGGREGQGAVLHREVRVADTGRTDADSKPPKKGKVEK